MNKPNALNIKCIVVKRFFEFYAEEKAAAIVAITKYLGCEVSKLTSFCRYDEQSELSFEINNAKEQNFLPILIILGGTADTLKCLQVTNQIVFATYATSDFLLDFPNFRFGVLPINLSTVPEPEYITRNSLSNSNMNLICNEIANNFNLKLSATINYSVNANSTGKYTTDYLTEYKKLLSETAFSVQLNPEYLIQEAQSKPNEFVSINYLDDNIIEIIKNTKITNLYYIDIGLSIFFKDTKQTDVLKFEIFQNNPSQWKVIYKDQLIGFTSYYSLVSAGINPNKPTSNYYERILQYMENAANAIYIQYGKQGDSNCFDEFFKNYEFEVI